MKRIKSRLLLGVLWCLMGSVAMAEPVMIAHAGGGYVGQNYTNSIEALDGSYQQGFRLMEIDFSWTADDRLVCLHDWKKTFKKLFKIKPKAPLSLAEFEAHVAAHPVFESCTLDTLAEWLADKPAVRIITDIKYHNLKGIELMLKRHPQLKSQLIPQFYQPEEYAALKQMGFDQLIWILYQYKGTKQSVVDWAGQMDLWAVSMRASQAKKKVFQKLRPEHRIFVYTINNEKQKSRLVNRYGVSGIYTDFLAVMEGGVGER